MTTAEHMKQYREIRGMSQTALARMSGVGQGNIWRYERGECSPTLETLMALCIALGCTIDEYVGVDYESENGS